MSQFFSELEKSNNNQKKKNKKVKESTEESDQPKKEEDETPATRHLLRWTEGDQDVSPFNTTINTYQYSMLFSSSPLSDLGCLSPQVVKVCGRSRDLAQKYFFVSSAEFRNAKLATTASQFAKSLLVAAFNDKALYECTLVGGEYRAAGRSNIRKKPSLDNDVVTVICGMYKFIILYIIILNNEGSSSWPENCLQMLLAIGKLQRNGALNCQREILWVGFVRNW